jgi:hypothetical protein
LQSKGEKFYLAIKAASNILVYEYANKSWQQIGATVNRSGTACLSMAIDHLGNPVVAWFEASTYVQYIRQWTGDSWREVGRFAGTYSSSCPKVVVSPLGHIFTLWADNRIAYTWQLKP